MPGRQHIAGPVAAALLLTAAGPVRAQYPAPYAVFPPGYPAPPPIYLTEPGHPADAPPPAEPGTAGPEAQPRWGSPYPASPQMPSAAPTQPWQAGVAPPTFAPEPATALARALLAPQNAVRAAVADPPLRWSDRLAAVARRWADHLIATGRFEHRVGDRYGENLYEITGGAATPRQVVAAWADEAQNYDLRTNACSGVCGHYTQIVWRATRLVGCAVASNADRQVWVCEYDPAGNWVGYRPF